EPIAMIEVVPDRHPECLFLRDGSPRFASGLHRLGEVRERFRACRWGAGKPDRDSLSCAVPERDTESGRPPGGVIPACDNRCANRLRELLYNAFCATRPHKTRALSARQ